VPEAADLGRLRADGWTEQDVQAFVLFARSTPAASVISTAKTKDLLAEVGVAATGLNVRQAHQIICEARAWACVEASAQLGQPMPYADRWARDILGDSPTSTAPTASAPPEAAAAPAVTSPPEPASSTSHDPRCSTLLAVLEEWRSTWAVRRQDLRR
jgi:hypothetical protein